MMADMAIKTDPGCLPLQESITSMNFSYITEQGL